MNKLNVLYIEDHLPDAEYLRSFFFDHWTEAIEFTHCLDLTEGVAFATERDVDVILYDLSLPDASGTEGLQKLLQHFPLAPVVILTGLHDEGRAREMLKLGAQDYLVKGDFTQSALKRVIDHAYERSQFLRKIKATEDALRTATTAAQAASLAKSEFLASMSHEIRIPLNAIIGVADLLIETPLNELQRQYVDMLQKSGSHLLDLINNILDLTKIEAGELQLHHKPFDMGQLLQSVANWASLSSRMKGLEFFTDLDPKMESTVVGDEMRLRQVLTNLIGNAIKFTQTGHIMLVVRTQPSPRPGFCEFRIDVADTGIGIPAEKQNLIFEKFTQADQSITRRFGGTGLGLSIVRRLIEGMGGRVTLQSTAGNGSTFTVSVPLELQKISASEKAKLLPNTVTVPRSKGGRVLIVEDVDDIRFVLERYLAGTAFEADYAENGLVAFDHFTNGTYDLVFMDLQMPTMDGYTAVQKIREWEQTNKRAPTPIVALTAHALIEEERRVRQNGFSHYLTKPIRKTTFLSAIDKFRASPAQHTESEIGNGTEGTHS